MPKTKELISSDSDSNDSQLAPKKSKRSTKKVEAAKPVAKSSDTGQGDEGETMYPLSKQRNVSVSNFRGKALINIREYFEKDGKTLPGRKGISLTMEQWIKLKGYIPDIDEQLKKL